MADYRPQWCARCFRPRQPTEYSCPSCASGIYTTEIRAGVTVRVHDGDRHWTQGRLRGLTRIPPGYVALVSGDPGAGKTTVSLDLFDDVQVVALETSGDLAAAYCTRIGVRHGGIYDRSVIDPDADLEGALALDRLAGGYAVFDSLSALGNRAEEALRHIMAWARRTGGRAVVIQHATKDGAVSGALSLQHYVEVVIWVGQRRGQRYAKTTKSRWAPQREVLFALEDDRADPTPRYAVVEGPVGGPYELVAWPPAVGQREPTYGGAYRLAERGELALPPPPLATAAMRSRLYPGGLVPAPDALEREAWAIDQGAPWMSVADLLAAQPEPDAEVS